MIDNNIQLLKPVIGLEVHIQLRTKSKMFSSAPNDQSVKDPNTNIDEVVLAHPGTLPVINEEAVRLAAMMGLALNCRIDEWSKFDRKHYFYPDLPKGYQISQLDQPIAQEGWIEIQVSDNLSPAQGGGALSSQGERKNVHAKRVLIQRAHLEEDAGKNMHPDGLPYSLVDYNRAGTPLLEIVTHPVIESAEEARKYLEELQRIARYVGASDADMEKGSMRCEPSISVRLPGEEGLPPYKVEVKNINSFKFVEQAINYEIVRQSELRLQGVTPKQVTMGWNEKLNKTVEQRSKEEANDYRYLPDPDLPPLHFTKEYLEKLRAELPELPSAKRLRFAGEYALPAADIENLLNWKELTFYFENVVSEIVAWLSDLSPSPVIPVSTSESSSAGRPESSIDSNLVKLIKLAANWCLQDFSAALKIAGKNPDETFVTPENLAELILMISRGEVSSAAAKQIFKVMFEKGGDPSEIVKDLGLSQVSDATVIEAAIDKVLSENEKAVQDFKAGQEKSFGFLVGQCMKELKGQGNPSLVNEVLRKKLQ
jgi:aspartyl-tRNA(Asn)/glutamyl-tRNA(Gln) amidotransferase subunit B